MSPAPACRPVAVAADVGTVEEMLELADKVGAQ